MCQSCFICLVYSDHLYSKNICHENIWCTTQNHPVWDLHVRLVLFWWRIITGNYCESCRDLPSAFTFITLIRPASTQREICTCWWTWWARRFIHRPREGLAQEGNNFKDRVFRSVGWMDGCRAHLFDFPSNIGHLYDFLIHFNYLPFFPVLYGRGTRRYDLSPWRNVPFWWGELSQYSEYILEVWLHTMGNPRAYTEWFCTGRPTDLVIFCVRWPAGYCLHVDHNIE